MISHETNIDTIALQIDFDDAVKQRNKLQLLTSWITGRELGRLVEVVTNQNLIRYELFHGNSKLATIHTGTTIARNKITGRFKRVYYIRIRFAGLKSYIDKYDKASFHCLMSICALLNVTGTIFKFVELDIALDAYCFFNNILVSCTRKASYVNYNPLNFKQYFNGKPTSYIENYGQAKQRKYAMLRSYLYDKTAKNSLPFRVTRFEVKLQNRFFIHNGFNLDSISKALNKYYVMYFRTKLEKEYMINRYNSYTNVTSRELDRLGFGNYRLSHNLNIVKAFIEKIELVTVGFHGDIIFLKKSKNIV